MKIIKLTTLLILFSCNNSDMSNKNHEESQDLYNEHIETISPEIKLSEMELSLSGKVIANPDNSASYFSLVDGIVVSNDFKFGQFVNKGDKMFDIRSSELTKLFTELNVAKRNFKSADIKFKNKLINESEFVQSKMELERLKSEISLIGENNDNGSFCIKSPISGYIIEKNISQGMTFSAGDKMFTIADLNKIRIEANIYAGDLRNIKEGQKVSISTIAYPDYEFKGKITLLSHIFNSDDKTLKAYIDIDNDGLKLKPDMSVIIKVLIEDDQQMTAIPSDVIIFDDNKYYVVTNNNYHQIKEIKIKQNNKGVSYISSGIESNDLIISKNQLLIYNELKGK